MNDGEEVEMRAKRTALAAAIVAAAVTWPGGAAANGGAYIDLDGTHYVPGDRGVAVAYVFASDRAVRLLDGGPFHLYLLPPRTSLEEGAPIPAGAIRIGTFSIEERGRDRELRAGFVTPSVEGGFYRLGLCNDPCTVTGFREPLTGLISVVATPREADLLVQNARLRSGIYVARSDLRRVERKLETATAEVGSLLETNRRERELLSSRIDALEARLAASRRRASDAERRASGLLVLLVIVGIGAATIASRMRRRGGVGSSQAPIDVSPTPSFDATSHDVETVGSARS